MSPGRAHRRSNSDLVQLLACRAHDAVDDVVDVGEVARMTAVIEDLDLLTRENFLGETKERHV